MLDTVINTIDDIKSDSTDFEQFYLNYIMEIQDMDVENEILPVVKTKTTTYLSDIKRIERNRKKRQTKRKQEYDFFS